MSSSSDHLPSLAIRVGGRWDDGARKEKGLISSIAIDINPFQVSPPSPLWRDKIKGGAQFSDSGKGAVLSD